jgi:hypothetical protein
MRKALFCLLFSCLVYFPKAQLNLPALNYIPQSPITAAFTRYGEIPVDLSTGVTAINIPVYTLSEHGINIPVSISYHASGIKVSDIASPVGLGWTLNAGGVITRQVLGIKDELLDVIGDSTLYERIPFSNTQEFYDYNYAREAQNRFIWADELHNMLIQPPGVGRYDFYSDRFYYSLANGESGIFRKDFKSGDIKLIPYKPIKTRFLFESTGQWNDPMVGLKIEMTTSDGTRYLFKRNRYDLWYPDKIFNSSNTDSIVFYSHTDTIRVESYSSSQDFGTYRNSIVPRTEAFINGTQSCHLNITDWNFEDGVVHQLSMMDDEVVLVDSIVGSGSVIRFTYAQDREDVTWVNWHNHPNARLTNIQVINKSTGTLIKNVDFSQAYSGGDLLDKRLMLTGIQTGANGDEKYEFKYNSESLPPYRIVPGPGSNNPGFMQDLWGYNHGSPLTTSTLLGDFAPSGVSDLFPNEDRVKACMLQEVKYPTGGKTVFEYESNRVPAYFYGSGFISPPTDGKVGGLRIKKISSYAYEGAVPQVKTYEYVCDLPKNYGYLDYDKFAYRQETYNYLYQADGCGPPVPEVGMSTKNVCVSSPMGRYIGSAQAPVFYTQVTEYNGDRNSNAGKSVYYYWFPSDHDFEDQLEPRYCGPRDTDWGNFTPLLQKKEEYKNVNGQYKLVRSTETEYTGLGAERFPTGFNLSSDLRFNNLGGAESAAFFYYNMVKQEYYFTTLHYCDVDANTGLYMPSKTSVYDYIDDNNYVKTSTEYSYNQYGQQAAASTTTSKGEVMTTRFTYPVDYPAQAPYSTMVGRNIISPVIEQSTFKSTNTPEVFLQSTKTNYNYWDYATQTWGNNTSDQILPQTVETKKGAKDAETRIRYYSYDDKSNPVYVSKENDVHQLFLWAYNKTYPVAQVINVPDDQKQYVVYNSFEAAEDAGSLIGIIVDDNTAPTGKKCLHLDGSGRLEYQLNSNSIYILSYWYKTGGSIDVTASSSILATSSPKNGWVYVKRKITGTRLLSIRSADSYIDEVRLYPESAQMTSYTYEPGIGMTTQCDVNDRIIYYTYDAAARLTLVKDDDGNVLKKICYNYQGQPDACGVNVNPQWQSTGATRCKPCPENPVYFSNITQGEERDNNPNSDSYGTTRWIDLGVIGGQAACFAPGAWEPTGNVRCKTLGGQNTGEQEREMKDMNPCSSSGGGITWESAGTNTTACPVPVVNQSLDVSGNYFRQGCSSPQLPLPYFVSMPQGAYTSSTSIDDATSQARAEAQRQANANGQCATLFIRAVPELDSDPSDLQQYSYYHFYFYSDAAGTIPLTLPVDVTINYKYHDWWIENGVYNDDGTVDNLTSPGRTGTNHTDAYVESTFCPDDNSRCWHRELILKPGAYVIIP